MNKLIINFIVIAAAVYFIPKNKVSNETVLLIALGSVVGFLLVDRLMGGMIEGMTNYLPIKNALKDYFSKNKDERLEQIFAIAEELQDEFHRINEAGKL